MSNTIKLKRGSGSDPSASDLSVGELAIRTDSGKIFTKKDNGSVAEISGGGGIDDGDKGDITVSNGGDTFLINSGAIDNANIASNAAIAGSKISPNFGSQNVSSTGYFSFGTAGGTDNFSKSNFRIENTHPTLYLNDTDSNNDFYVRNADGVFNIHDVQAGVNRFTLNSSGTAAFSGNLDVGAGIDVTGASTFSGGITSTGNLTLSSVTPQLYFTDTNHNPDYAIWNHNGVLRFLDTTNSNATRLEIQASGLVKASNGFEVTGNITATGTIGSSNITITNSQPFLSLQDSDNENDFEVGNAGGLFRIRDVDAAVNRLTISSAGVTTIAGNLDVGAGLDVTGVITATSHIDIPDGAKIKLGTDDDLNIFHDGSNSYLQNITGNLIIKNNATDYIKFINSDASTEVVGNLRVGNFTRSTNGYGVGSTTIISASRELQNVTLNSSSVTATTQSAGDNSTKIATTAYTDTAISNLVDSSPSTLNTLNELAAALGDDANFSTTVTNSIATKLPLAGGTLSGDLTVNGVVITGSTTNLITGNLAASTQLAVVSLSGNNNYVNQTILGGRTGRSTLNFGDQDNYYVGSIEYHHDTNSINFKTNGSTTSRLTINSDGHVDVTGNLDVGAGIDVTGDITGTGDIEINNINKSLKVGDLSNDNYVDLRQISASSYKGFSFQHSNASVLANLQGTTNQYLVLGDNDANNSGTLFGISIDAGGTISTRLTLSASGNLNVHNNITLGGTVDGRDLATDGSKLDGIESGATADQTASEILTLIKTVDGAGSGLDADTLDGFGSGQFIRSDVTDTVSGGTKFTSTGLELSGHWFNRYYDSANAQNYIHLYPASSSDRDTTASTTDIRAWTGSTFKVLQIKGDSNDITWGGSKLWTAANDGSGSGLDSDLLDGVQGSSYLRSDANDTMSQALTLSLDSTDVLNFSAASTNDSRGIAFNSRTALSADSSDGWLRINQQQEFSNGTYTPGMFRADGGIQVDSSFVINASGNVIASKVLGFAAGDASNLNAGTLPAARLGTASTSEFGVSATGNFGQIEGHGTYSDFNTEPAYWGWNYVQGNTNAPNTTSSQWYRCRLSLGSSYGKGSDSGDYSLEMALPRYSHSSAGVLHIRTIEAGNEGSWTTVGDNASLITTGTLPAARLPNHSASLLTSGTIPAARLSASDLLTKIKTVDGAGSGLDADTLDGISSASFLRSDAADTASSTITFSGGINVGNLNDGGITGSNYNISGVNQITFNDPGEGLVFKSGLGLILIDDANDNICNFYGAAELRVNNSKVWTASNDGAGSGLDADLLDGVQQAEAATASTIVKRNSAGNIYANFINTPASDVTSGVTKVMVETGNDNFIRHGSAAAVRTFLNVENGATADQSASEILTLLKTVDGAGSGLDADLLDGVSSGSYVRSILTDDDITGRLGSGFYETNSATTAEGWPVTSNSWYHLIASTHSNTANYYSMQIAGDFFSQNNFYIRSTGSSGTQAWSEIWTSSSDGSGSGLDADTVDGIQGASLLRSDAADTASGDITFSGGAGAVTIGANSDATFVTGSWTGNHTKIQHHSNRLYIVGGSAGIRFREAGADRWDIDPSGHFVPTSDSTYNIGSNGTRVANGYFDTLYGDGSNLTGISAGATGGGSDEVFYENDQTVTTNYTITNGKNAMAAGPITINSGVTVTVGSGETLTIV